MQRSFMETYTLIELYRKKDNLQCTKAFQFSNRWFGGFKERYNIALRVSRSPIYVYITAAYSIGSYKESPSCTSRLFRESSKLVAIQPRSKDIERGLLRTCTVRLEALGSAVLGTNRFPA